MLRVELAGRRHRELGRRRQAAELGALTPSRIMSPMTCQSAHPWRIAPFDAPTRRGHRGAEDHRDRIREFRRDAPGTAEPAACGIACWMLTLIDAAMPRLHTSSALRSRRLPRDIAGGDHVVIISKSAPRWASFAAGGSMSRSRQPAGTRRLPFPGLHLRLSPPRLAPTPELAVLALPPRVRIEHPRLTPSGRRSGRSTSRDRSRVQTRFRQGRSLSKGRRSNCARRS
jgi:hypothetical protein